MEDPVILKMNLDRFRRLLKIEVDLAKRRTMLKLIAETEEKLRLARSIKAPSSGDERLS